MPRSQALLKLFLLEAPAPGLDALRELLPELIPTPLGAEIPLGDRAPEEILSLCLRCGVTARATRIVERTASG
jgi:hypothetical protein